MKHKRTAFTLIELLVVITIIVVLLSLLAPAMDQAIYQAELAVCGARQNATCKGLSVYAMDFKRSYPYRLVAQVSDRVYPWQLNVGAQARGGVPPGIDDRKARQHQRAAQARLDTVCDRSQDRVLRHLGSRPRRRGDRDRRQ